MATSETLKLLSKRTEADRRTLSETQKEAVTSTVRRVARRLQGVDAEYAAQALICAVAAHRGGIINRKSLQDALASELRRYYTAGSSQRTAERILKGTDLNGFQPAQGSNQPPTTSDRAASTAGQPGRTVQEIDIADHLITFDAEATLRTLGTTNLLRDLGPVVAALTEVFTALQRSTQPHVTRIFLAALDNRFAIAVPQETMSKCRRSFAQPRAHLSDVQRLPTTQGLIILEGGGRLSAWNVTPDSAEVASIEVNALRTYLRSHRAPSMVYEALGPRQSTPGSSMRDLAGIAHRLRERDAGMHPLHVDSTGATHREWSEKQLRRMGQRSPHRVREHLRTLPGDGRLTTVQEHSRHGLDASIEVWRQIRLL